MSEKIKRYKMERNYPQGFTGKPEYKAVECKHGCCIKREDLDELVRTIINYTASKHNE